MIDKNFKDLDIQYSEVKDRITNIKSHYEELIVLSLNYLKNEMAVCDAGCGNGDLLFFLSTILKKNNIKCDLFGFDVSQAMIDRSKKRLKNITINQEYLPKLSYPSSKFDLIFLSEVLEHVHDPLTSLRELQRISKRNGKIIISIPNGDRFYINEVLENKKIWQPADDVFYTFSEINLILRSSGWRVKKFYSIGKFFPRLKNQSIFKRTMFTFTESIFNKFNLFQLRRKTMIIVAMKDDYFIDGSLNKK